MPTRTRGARVEPEPPRPRRGGRPHGALVLLVGVLVIGGIATVLAWGWLRTSHQQGPAGRAPFYIPHADSTPGVSVPSPGGQQPADAQAAQAFVAATADTTDIPERALRAYLGAQTALARRVPACRLSWTTLAGLGWVESKHGSHGGSAIGADGQVSPPIIGLPLDGTAGHLKVLDTDGGALDGDQLWDHALGPMQFVPETWKRFGQRASGDKKAPDPQNIDDAALTAGWYLCTGRRDLATGPGWWSAVKVYNNSDVYAGNVYSAAQAYGEATIPTAAAVPPGSSR